MATAAPSPFAAAAGSAAADLALRLSVSPTEISVQSGEQVDWPNSALGCAEPELRYLQVIIPGWRLTLGHQGVTYEYHADLDGERVVTCDAKLRGG